MQTTLLVPVDIEQGLERFAPRTQLAKLIVRCPTIGERQLFDVIGQCDRLVNVEYSNGFLLLPGDIVDFDQDGGGECWVLLQLTAQGLDQGGNLVVVLLR